MTEPSDPLLPEEVSTPVGSTVEDHALQSPRPDERVILPPHYPVEASPLTENDRMRMEATEKAKLERERQNLQETLTTPPAGLHLSAWLAHPLVRVALVGMVALFGYAFFTQMILTLSALATFPSLARYVGMGGLVFCSLAVLYAGGCLLVFYLRLPPNSPIRVKRLTELAEHSRWRQLGQDAQDEARKELTVYLKTYPLDEGALCSVGFKADHIQQLRKAQEYLLRREHFASTTQWLQEFPTRFQAVLDRFAKERIDYHAKHVGLRAAISPNALIDTLVTAYGGFALLGDLCRIYNRRSDRLETAVLLIRVFFNAYVAGQVNEVEQVADTHLENWIHESGLHVGSLAADTIVGTVIARVGTKAAAGFLNYLLLKRLGKYSLHLLQPADMK